MTTKLEMSEAFDCARSPEDAFNYIADFSRISEWDHTILSSQKSSPGAIGLGSTFSLIFSMGLRKVPLHYEITEYEPNSKVVLTGTSSSFTAIDTVSISQTELGCHVNWHAALSFKGVAAKLVPLIKKRVVSGGQQTIRDLATALADDYKVPELGVLPKIGDALILPGLFGFTKYGFQNAKKQWQPVTANIKGKHAVITGATSGLGLATATQLAHLGADLTLVARNKAKCEQVARSITEKTGNANIRIEVAELSEIQEVILLAQRLIAQARPVDILINNAGALLNPREETSEGLEKSFALLLLSPYVLTETLYPLLQKSGTARVINVSSGGMYATRLSISNIENTQGSYRGADAYARAKRGLVITGEQWAQRWAEDGITVHNMHPGWAATPGVEVGLPTFNQRMAKVLRTPEQGADTIIWLSTASEVAKTSGLFWLDRQPHPTHLTRKTKETAKQRQALSSVLEDYASRFNTDA